MPQSVNMFFFFIQEQIAGKVLLLLSHFTDEVTEFQKD